MDFRNSSQNRKEVKMSEIADNERDSRSQTKSNIKRPPKQISKQTKIKDSTRNPI